MKKVYVTITGMKYYYGFNPFSIGKKLTCKKEHNNPYDSEAIKVTMKNIGTVGYIANSPYSKANGTMGAGAVNKYVKCVQSCALHTNGRTTTILRSGIICFSIAQTIYTNWKRRLAVRADNMCSVVT